MDEEVADWEPDKGRLGRPKKVTKEPEVLAGSSKDPPPPQRPNEKDAAYRLRMAKEMGYETAAEMHKRHPFLKLKGPGRPPGPGKP